MVKEVEDVVTVALFAVRNAKTRQNRVVVVLVLHVVANVLQSVRDIQKQVVVVLAPHVVANVLLGVKDKPLKDVQIAHHSVLDPVIRHVKQDVACNAIGHVAVLATNNARAIV